MSIERRAPSLRLGVVFAACAALACIGRGGFELRRETEPTDTFDLSLLPITASASQTMSPNGLGVAADGSVSLGATFQNPQAGSAFLGTLVVGDETFPNRTSNLESFIAKWSMQGEPLWTRVYASNSLLDLRQLRVSNSGLVIACMILAGTADFQGVVLNSGGSQQAPAILVHSADGAIDARSRVLPSQAANVQCRSISLNSGFAAAAGIHSQGATVNLGGGNIPVALADPNSFIVSYTSNLTFRWHRAFIGTGTIISPTVVATSDGGAYAGMLAAAGVDMGNGNVPITGPADIVLGRYGPSGEHLFSRALGGSGSEAMVQMVLRAGDDGVVFCGASTAPFAADAFNVTNAGGDDIVLADIAASGAVRWMTAIGGAGTDACADIVIDAEGNVYVSGLFQETVDFGGQTLTAEASPAGFIASYDSAGVLRWARQPSGSTSVRRMAIEEPSGSLWFTGTFEDTLVLDGATITGPANSLFVYRWPLQPD